MEELHHYLPSQAPLKDFIHHNTLHAFQQHDFHEAMRRASRSFGYSTYLSVAHFRKLYASGAIRADVLNDILVRRFGFDGALPMQKLMLEHDFGEYYTARVGTLRAEWKAHYSVNLDKEVHPTLFRLLSSYLDQGVSIWSMKIHPGGFLCTVRYLQQNSTIGFLSSKRARALLLDDRTTITDLLAVLVGDERLYERYLFDQQFAHPGWSGMASTLEHKKNALLLPRKISLKELVTLELLLEIDTLDRKFGAGKWMPLGNALQNTGRINEFTMTSLLDAEPATDIDTVRELWQEAFEWSYYHQVLCALQAELPVPVPPQQLEFQALFCIDDRECSIRRYTELFEPRCRTYGTPGFFNVDAYFLPENGRFATKICPAPMQPKHIITEKGHSHSHRRDAHFTSRSHSLFTGWIISQTLGFWSAVQLVLSIVKPNYTAAAVSSATHSAPDSQLNVEASFPPDYRDGLQVGYTVEEMADRVEALLRSIGLVSHFAPVVYVVGHGASSANNTHYAGYDCGACSGRPGSVNSRVFAAMANHRGVRSLLSRRGIIIPLRTVFVGALHDTTRDDISFYPETVGEKKREIPQSHLDVFHKALDANAKERSRRFELVNTHRDPHGVHERVKLRSVSLFEPRPELNHATNALCIVGRRELSDHVFLDRRAFMNSYDYSVDPAGHALKRILDAATPVCGGINLEYYFSRVDNNKLGAGSKLPHNVVGLIGVANGLDGDLRTGLPWQMVELHDPLRLMMVVEHSPEVVKAVLDLNPATREWYAKRWMHLVVIEPLTKRLYQYVGGDFEPLSPVGSSPSIVTDVFSLIESSSENIPVHLLTQQVS